MNRSQLFGKPISVWAYEKEDFSYQHVKLRILKVSITLLLFWFLCFNIDIIFAERQHSKHGHTDQNKQIYSLHLELITSLGLL